MEFIEAAQSFLTTERIDGYAKTHDGLYEPNNWQQLADLGLFSLFAPEEFGGQNRGAFGIALLSSCLRYDRLCSVDLAIYVQGIVAVTTLAQSTKIPLAQHLLSQVVHSVHRLYRCRS